MPRPRARYAKTKDLPTPPEVEGLPLASEADFGAPDALPDDETVEVPKDAPDDLFSPDPRKMAELRKAGVDVAIVRLRLYRWYPQLHRKERLEGTHDAKLVSVAWIKSRFGPGTYDVHGMNQAGEFIASARLDLGDYVSPRDAADDAADRQAAAKGDDETKALLRDVLRALTQRPQEKPEPIREAVAAMTNLIQMQSTLAQQQLELRMRVNEEGRKQDPLVEKLLELVLARASAPDAGGVPAASQLDTLRMGIAMGTRLAGAPGAATSEKEPGWLEVVPELADSIGVPLIASFAQAVLPPERANQVLDAIRAHTEARAAAAKAAPIDTEGQS